MSVAIRTFICLGLVGTPAAACAAADLQAFPAASLGLAAAATGEARDATSGGVSRAGGTATSADGAVETGTDPAKLLLRAEFNPQFIETRGEGSQVAANFKLDVPFTKSFAAAVELPVLAALDFPDPLEDQYGLGDVFVRLRNVWSFERSSVVAGVEFGLKTADDELLGSGKWQVNPSFAYVYYLSSEFLLAIAAKQRWSVAGDDDRDDINRTELRLIGIYINPDGWWMQLDYQPKIDWHDDASLSHLIEAEIGTMLTRSVGISFRPGVGVGENRDREWSVGLGFRVFF